MRGLKPSPTVAINELSDELRRHGRTIYKLGLGQSPFPVPAPVVEALRANAPCKDYLPVCGLAELREAVADHHRRRHGIACTRDDVLVAPGSKELMFLLQVAYDGELVVPSPAWVSYVPQAQIVGRPVRRLHTRAENGWRLEPEQLDALCREDPNRSRILVLNYPGNPTGGTYDADSLSALADVARRYGVVILSDEIYGDLHHRGRHVSIARVYAEGTIISTGLSKWCGAGGWRLGAFLFPESMRWLLKGMAAVASETYTSTCAPVQHAAVTAFRGGATIEAYLWRARHLLAALGGELHAMLERAGARVEPPVGAFYLFPDFGPAREGLAALGVHTSEDLARRLLEDTGVATLPGADFGRPSSELALRLAYVNFDGARAMAALEALPAGEPVDAELIQTFCTETLAAVSHLCDWLPRPTA